MHVITKIISVNNKLGFYVALTLFWALYLSYFKKDSHHYYKMYNVDKFFKLLLSNEPFNDNQDSNSLFQLLLLISIYQNYVLLNKENPATHQVFQDFFKVSHHDREKLKEWLINMKHLIEVNNPLGKSNQTPDVLMVSSVTDISHLLYSMCLGMTVTTPKYFENISMRDSIRGVKRTGGERRESFVIMCCLPLNGLSIVCRDAERKNVKVERNYRWALTAIWK